MTSLPLLNELQSKGVEVLVLGNSLKIDAPIGVLTPELKQQLSMQKDELIAALKEQIEICSICKTPMERSENDTMIFFDCPNEHYSLTHSREFVTAKGPLA